MVFSVWCATEATFRHLENASIATTEKTTTRYVKRQGGVWTVFWLEWNCSHEIHPRRCNWQNPLQGDLGRLSELIRRKRSELWLRKNSYSYTTIPLHLALSLSKRNLQGTILPHPLYSPDLAPCDFCPFPRMKVGLLLHGVNLSRPKRSWLPQGKATILREDVDLFNCTPCCAASCVTYRFFGCLLSRRQSQNLMTVVVCSYIIIPILFYTTTVFH